MEPSPTPASAAPPPPPARQDSHWTRSSGADKSLESFAITTTPFHEPGGDGEYYMDEDGRWLHRWVTSTAVKATGTTRTGGATTKEGADADREDSGWEEGRCGRDGEMDSSSSSEGMAEKTRRLSQQAPRPRLNRHSRSSFIASERANHKSPDRVHARIHRDPATPANQRDDPVQTQGPDETAAQHQLARRPSSAENSESWQPVRTDDSASPQQGVEPLSAAALSAAFSCPSSPTQQPVVALGQRSTPPSPQLVRTEGPALEQLPNLDGPSPPPIRPSRARRGSRRSSNPSRPWSQIQLQRAATEDPYLAHQRAVELFSPPAVQGRPPESTRRPSLPLLAPAPSRTISAAEFLASKPEEVRATLPARPERRPSQPESAAILNPSQSRSTLNQGGPPSQRASTHEPAGVDADPRGSTTDNIAAGLRDEAPVSLVPVLTDHRIALDWTHPETRARAERKRRGVLGRVKRILGRSPSRTRRMSVGGADGDRPDHFTDAGSVRRLRVESVGKLVHEAELAGPAEGDASERPSSKGGRIVWGCFGG